jgi:hypothetical protein
MKLIRHMTFGIIEIDYTSQKETPNEKIKLSP